MNQLLAPLDVQVGPHIIGIGFGGGDLLNRLLQAEWSLQITGIDPSPASIVIVQKRFKQEIAAK